MIKYDEILVGNAASDLHEKIQVALANIPVSLHQIEASFLGRPDLSRERLKPFATLLNEISQYRNSNGDKVDLLVFPEVSVPYDWEPMLVAWARKHGIGVVCGLEHHVSSRQVARNEVLACLPYRSGKNRWACAPIRRLKRLYSPEETFVLTNHSLKTPRAKKPYQLFRWRGASFAIYNCYELASIEDRCLFKGKVDFIIGTEFNRDVHYFSNIAESAARDLHCYVIQVNDSQFGDSRIVCPSKSDKMNPLRIKGGENLTFLTMTLELKALRDYQRKGYGLQKESDTFKPTPPEFSREDLLHRIGLGESQE